MFYETDVFLIQLWLATTISRKENVDYPLIALYAMYTKSSLQPEYTPCQILFTSDTAAEAVETSLTTTNRLPSLSQDHTNLDDHISQTSINTPRFKPFTLLINSMVIVVNLLVLVMVEVAVI